MPIVDVQKVNKAKNTVLELTIAELEDFKKWFNGLVTGVQLKHMFPKAPIHIPMPPEEGQGK